MLQIAVGLNHSLIQSKERAIDFYNGVEGRKTFHAVETQQGVDDSGNTLYVTTIWFTLLPPIVEQPPEQEKFEFIGSVDIDPTDPDWLVKWQQQRGVEIGAVASQDGLGEAEE